MPKKRGIVARIRSLSEESDLNKKHFPRRNPPRSPFAKGGRFLSDFIKFPPLTKGDRGDLKDPSVILHFVLE